MVADILAGKTAPSKETPTQAEGVTEIDTPAEAEAEAEAGAEAGAEELTPAKIAEGLGVEAEQVYDMSIPVGDLGETVKIGKLKDAWLGRVAAERESAEKEAALNSREAAVISDQQAWAMLAANGQLDNGTLQQAREIVAEKMQSEQQMLFDLVPELQDQAKLDLFRKDLVRVMGQVGYKPHEILIGDHRQGLLLRRFVQMEQENAAMKKQLRPKPPRTAKPQGRGAPSKPNYQNARGGTEAQKLQAVSNLISGKR
jgi:hypothetical protein